MPTVEIYTTQVCPYCDMAKALLTKKGLGFNEIHVDHDADLAAEAVARSGGRRTVPQIFIDGRHVGGYDELKVMDKNGELDNLTANP